MLSSSPAYGEGGTTFPEDALVPITPTPTQESLTEETQIVRAYFGRHRQGSLMISFRREDVSDAVVELIPEIIGLLRLEPGWDSYGSLAVSPKTVANAIELIASVMAIDSLPPLVMPTGRGGIQFQWEAGSRYLEIEVLPSENSEAYYADSANPAMEVEGDFTLRKNELRRYVEALTSG